MDGFIKVQGVSILIKHSVFFAWIQANYQWAKMTDMEHIRSIVVQELELCTNLISENSNSTDQVIARLDSIISTLNYIPDSSSSLTRVHDLILQAVDILEHYTGSSQRGAGRPKINITTSSLEYLLSMNFKVPDLAHMYGVSRKTIYRRLREAGLSVSDSYTKISEEDLSSVVVDILLNHPNTGYKRMKGFLLMRSIKVTDQRVREVMRTADPQGVFQRTIQNRAIVRREYFVQFSNQMWHLDANLKLIRWGLVIRGGIDGKSRCVTYLNVGSDNKAESSLEAFMQGVSVYGIPQRTRSDKGKENILVAKYMLETRGLGRASHICGRSVHNQRIERFWGDLFRMTSFYYNVFKTMEENFTLDVDNSKHVKLLQLIYIPRIQRHMDQFKDGWNCHPLSTESNRSPNQLMLLHLPPPEADLPLSAVDSADLHFTCEDHDDLNMFEDNESIAYPLVDTVPFSANEIARLQQIDPLAESEFFGCDLLTQALQCLQ